MRIYFEDGELRDIKASGVPDNAVIIDASCGVSNNVAMLDTENQNAIVYTNQILAFSHRYGWNNDDNHTDIFIRHPSIVNGDWKRIDKLTDRAIKMGNNVGKLYIAGEFLG